MKAILMAAGIGSRISRSTKKPKSTLGVGNMSIIEHTVNMLTKNGIDVAVVVGYKKEEIFEELENYKVTFFYNPFFKVTNSMASLWFAKDFLKAGEDVLLANADVFWEQPILDRLLSLDGDAVMLGDSSRIKEGDYFFKLTDDGHIVKYGKELVEDERTCEYVGIARLKKEFLPTFVERLDELIGKEAYDWWWENVLYNYSDKTPVVVEDICDQFWAEVDYIEDYERILEYLRNGKK